MKTTVKSRLEDLLKSSGMTENDLAKTSKVEYTTIHRIITGETSNPSRNTLAPLAKALNANLDYLHKGVLVESELTLLQKTFAKLEEQIDKKDAMIERLMNQLFDGNGRNFLQALNLTGLPKKRQLRAKAA